MSGVCQNTTASQVAATDSSWNARLPALFALFVFLVSCLSCIYIYSGYCIKVGPPIRADGFGYYAYLPAIFIDHDLTMKTALANRWTVVGDHPPPYNWDGISTYKPTGKLLDRYTSGTALLQAPFFLVAHATALAFRLPPYSLPYQIANVLSGIVFLTLGVFLLLRYLLARFPIRAAVLSVSAIVFGTNVFHYGTYDASFSHIYSFFLIGGLLTLLGSYRDRSARSASPLALYCFSIGAIVGLIALTRVPNIIVGIIPLTFVCEKFYRTRNARALRWEVLAGLLGFVLVFSLQMAYWHAVTGRFFLNSYQVGYFNWASPQVLSFLFSIRKGLFVWCPIAIVAVFGSLLLVRADKTFGLAICTVVVLEVYICSCWSQWWFGGGFGSRPFADMMPLLALPLAHALEWMNDRFGRLAPASMVGIFVSINLFLMYSFWCRLFPISNVTLAAMAELPIKWETHSFLPLAGGALPLPYAPGTQFRAEFAPPLSMQMEGWELRHGPGLWTVGNEASLSIRPILPATGDLQLDMTFSAVLLTARHPRQRAIVKVDGTTIGKLEFSYKRDNSKRTLIIPRRLLRNWQLARIVFDLPDAAAPQDLGINRDPRLLALCVSRIDIVSAEPRR
jgi:hypothetical protein